MRTNTPSSDWLRRKRWCGAQADFAGRVYQATTGVTSRAPGIIGRMNQPLTQQRIRIRFGQDGPLRYVGHHDLARTWERILRRARAPLEYSQGFNPRPRMQFAAALPI